MSEHGQKHAMVVSRGGITGGFTIAEALGEFERRGYIGQFAIRGGGMVECISCGCSHAPSELAVNAMRRVEGASDPADMVFIGALQCACCGERGTAVVPYGPMAQADDGAVLRELENRRLSSEISRRDEDRSLVSDTGWMPKPW